jgi:predicted P-loop ATPase
MKIDGEPAELGRVVPLNVAPKKRSNNRTAKGPRAPWTDACIKDEGRIVPCLANVMVALRDAAEIADVFAYDEMARDTVIVGTLPGGANGGSLPRQIGDADVSQLQEWLQRNGMPKIGKDTTHQAVDLRARERSFHPVRDYLGGLKWDGAPRLDRWLTTYLGSEPSAYVAAIGRMFLIAMVARIFKPGCKVDYMLVLEGDQGLRKSQALRVLAGEWFSDNLPDLHFGDAVRLSMHFRNKWLIEVGELSSFSKAGAAELKSFISRSEERFTPKFARKEVKEPRQCVFAGTINEKTYLKDETGNRRFWPAPTTNIDLSALAANRDQLFAEALVAFRTGAQWWPDGAFERAYIKPEQDARYQADPWHEIISAYVAGRKSVLPGQIAKDALKIETARLGTIHRDRVTAVLVALGWTRSEKKDREGYFPYFPPQNDG